MPKLFKKILIANRGEIAVRLIRACHELGIAAVAVYSEPDRASLHVVKADEAYPIGAAPAVESYLNIDRIIETAKGCHADAIHPGYGFLSENAAFAMACGDAGIKFIGPSPASIDLMGSKTRARQQMEKAGVPFVPGTSRGLESLAKAREVAAKFGYPVMLKAAAGGGGKGMRLVAAEAELAASLDAVAAAASTVAVRRGDWGYRGVAECTSTTGGPGSTSAAVLAWSVACIRHSRLRTRVLRSIDRNGKGMGS